MEHSGGDSANPSLNLNGPTTGRTTSGALGWSPWRRATSSLPQSPSQSQNQNQPAQPSPPAPFNVILSHSYPPTPPPRRLFALHRLRLWMV
ncbi:hypothetical protein CEP52_003660 [Fusarium oligoseptatum]|uniref:Uncharacterized protein n=1 Tax=Fusarium oligoseptatum TaxID=2604345 RepID=A0A428U7R7_9HYPO|nr:hypothetical protein CEP52_003660 [Fusarium oligoseptatum]